MFDFHHGYRVFDTCPSCPHGNDSCAVLRLRYIPETQVVNAVHYHVLCVYYIQYCSYNHLQPHSAPVLY